MIKRWIKSLFASKKETYVLEANLGDLFMEAIRRDETMKRWLK